MKPAIVDRRVAQALGRLSSRGACREKQRDDRARKHTPRKTNKFHRKTPENQARQNASTVSTARRMPPTALLAVVEEFAVRKTVERSQLWRELQIVGSCRLRGVRGSSIRTLLLRNSHAHAAHIAREIAEHHLVPHASCGVPGNQRAQPP